MARPQPHFRLVAVIGIAILAAALRILHVNHGLPDFTEEAFVFRKALELWGAGDGRIALNPHAFEYPSLTIYLHFCIQYIYYLIGAFEAPADFLLSTMINPTGPVVSARMLNIVADIATLAFVGRIAQRFSAWASVLAMIIVAVSPAMIVTSRLLNADAVMCALLVAAVERLLVYRDRGGWLRLLVTSALVGIAAGAKYPGMLMAVPLGVAIWQRQRGYAALRASAVAAGAAVIAFLATTPFLITSWGEFVRDAAFVGRIAREGGLGKLEGHGFHYYVLRLVENLGWVGIVAMAASVLAAWRSSSQGAIRLVWLSWLVMFAPIAWLPVEAERYLVAIVALGSILMAAGVEYGTQVSGITWRTVGRIGLLLLLMAQPIWFGIRSAKAGRSTTQREARRWCEAHVQVDALVLAEAGGPLLLTHAFRAQVTGGPVFRNASAAMQSAFRHRRASYLVWLPLIVSGYTPVHLPSGELSMSDVYPHAVDWNAAVYDIRLLRDVDYVITTGAVRGRFEMDTVRFREQRKFYSMLDQDAERVAQFLPGDGIDGPAITIYRLPTRAREVIAKAGVLDTLWWARTVPESFRRRAEQVLRKYERPDEFVTGIPIWVQPLRVAYSERYGKFANDLAENLGALQRLTTAKDLCLAGLTIVPEDIWALQVYIAVASQLGNWMETQLVLGRSIDVLARYGRVPPEIVLARVDALLQIGEVREAEHHLRSIVTGSDSSYAQIARQRLTQLRARER